ncbi:hypothetical protein Q5H92_13160 [Hymenobacter sp. M29]|uniref:Uncharacterized protein n=1 Tax=Hymenobacter mellowenesis TaxID=3063995 RepID=A0ABT9ABU8_9BACT|nr:hypothetical protein [Hymenobacter sp. M29]MDO7847315.1 hypothetical protein [Hymenobacter sp. M29]
MRSFETDAIATMKKHILGGLLLWLMAEAGHQADVYRTYQLNGRFSWAYYALCRNRPAIDRLHALAAQRLTQRAFVEIRHGAVVDSAGHLSRPLRVCVLELAHDLQPAGTFYADLQPVKPAGEPFAATSPCGTTRACQCLDWLGPAVEGGFLLGLSGSGPERGHTSTEFEFVRVNNPTFQAVLQHSLCYTPVRSGEFIASRGVAPGWPLPYNDDRADLLIIKALQGIGIL